MSSSWFRPALFRSTFGKGWTGERKFPLRKKPLMSDGLEMLVLGRNDFAIPQPTHLGGDGFEAELAEVLRVRDDVLRGEWPDWFFTDHDLRLLVPAPLTMGIDGINVSSESPSTAANIVHMDDPMDLGKLLRKWLMSQDHRTFKAAQGSSNGFFLELIPNLNRDLAVAIDKALMEAAQAKQFFGRARPEEIVCYNMTAYSEGCPKHPAYPAGHGAVAGATFAVLEREFELKKYRVDVLETCLHWSMYRTLAGVHYANDNAIGFLLGYAKTAGLESVAEAAKALGWGERYVS